MLLETSLRGKAICSFAPRGLNWLTVQKEAQRQTVMGQAFGVIEENYEVLQLPLETKLGWYANAQYLAKQNKMVNQVLFQVVHALRKVGIPSLLLKGQGCALYYPQPQYRSPGDIDLYVGNENFDKAKACLQEEGLIDRWVHDDVKHSELVCQGVSLELHRYADLLPGRAANRKFQAAMREALDASQDLSGFWVDAAGNASASGSKGETACEFVRTLPLELNAVYVFIHLFRHFIAGGISLRQVYDWLFLCKQPDFDKYKAEDWLDRFGFWDSWRYFSYMAVEYLGADQDWMLAYGKGYSGKSRAILRLLLRGRQDGEKKAKYKWQELMLYYKSYLNAFSLFPFESLTWLGRAIRSNIEKYIKKQ